ncbi:MAG: hypothetical protein IID44_19670 [Planctomycetes bacterium]|nr:hypothetical protein [Planctomycetota bacterium]
MNGIKKGEQVLRDAETALQHLMAEAATNGEYDSLPTLAGWAQRVGKLPDEPEDSRRASRRVVGKSAGTNSNSAQKSMRKRRSAEYPKFVRDDNNLVKIGWSKTDRSEYEHKASRQTVQAIASSIFRLGRTGDRFAMEDVLPVEDLGGDQIPNYQCYLTLAWLRSIQLVERHGRLGYTIAKGIDHVEAVDDCWSRLANRSTAKVGSAAEQNE